MTLYVSIRLIRLPQPVMPFLTENAVTRTAFAQFSAHPWHLSPDVTLEEIRSFADSLSFNELLHNWHMTRRSRARPQIRLTIRS